MSILTYSSNVGATIGPFNRFSKLSKELLLLDFVVLADVTPVEVKTKSISLGKLSDTE